MVRLKQRYILFDILYPPSSKESHESEDFINFSKSEQNALLTLHQSSPGTINQKTLTQLIRKVIQDHYGDFGAGTAGMQLTIKYFSNKTSTGIIRCGRSCFQLVIAALTLINRIGGREVLIRCIHVSGTIKKCEEFSIKKNRELMLMVSKNISGKSEVNRLISKFEEASEIINVSDNEVETD